MKVFLRLIGCSLLAVICVTNASATTPFFWDDFERDELYDTDIEYFRDPTPEEELSIVDGNLSLVPIEDNYPGVAVLNLDFGRVRLETSFRFVDAPNGINPFFFFNAGEDLGIATDWAGVASDGRMIPGTFVDNNTDWTQSRRLAGHNEIVSNDVHMVMMIDNDEQLITAWIDGNDLDPDFQLTEDRVTSHINELGLFLNPDSQLQEHILIRHFAVLPFISGDFDASDRLDVGDIDMISAFLRQTEEARPKSRIRVFDLNKDGKTDAADRENLISTLFRTYLGDSNLDGEFNSADFVAVFQAGEYEDELVGNSTWATGDWNGDAEFDSGDFVAAFQEGGYEQGPRTDATAVVPEPSSTIWLLGCLSTMIAFRRKRCAT